MTLCDTSYVFIIQLKRYSYSGGITSKIDTLVGASESLTVMGNNFTLMAVCKHIGSQPTSGHYIACCRETSGKWTEYNDSKTRNIMFAEVIDSNSYIFFYVLTEAMS